MTLFHGMTQVTFYIVLTVVVLLGISIRKNPLLAAGVFVSEIFTNRKFLIHFVLMIGILFVNKFELWLENNVLTNNDNYSRHFFKIEGNFVYNIQTFFHNDILTLISTYFYVAVFPALMIVSIGIYTYQKNFRLFYTVCYAVMLNYLLAIPFYLFFPIDEVWAHLPQVKLLMVDVFPTFETQYRPLSGLDNCFPSLHTSISVTMALIAAHSGNVFWKRFTAFTAVFIIFSIFYLGVHWFIDMCGGLALAFVAVRIAMYLADSRPLLRDVVVSASK